ncbi:hypothetical protein [Slackia heliotrinireducens]|uniref:Uncharacterized protein n=1 Tax=Slackia heliotrinireducens (strain ATCC 29202 / DSM 20476 / NCTC 11029 / RHS 1) TaxID=471855 RepID=C7N2Y9_SLAHD|nr:hypothetical protein [Slackia heliotrinireducens]ACV21510.1 hypothetical protein Shel_04500 [Slackia heliotrinireducens DSM 20476]VEG98966.1 Uncharacterised protein [Slackia heliotrinireducens]
MFLRVNNVSVASTILLNTDAIAYIERRENLGTCDYRIHLQDGSIITVYAPDAEQVFQAIGVRL